MVLLVVGRLGCLTLLMLPYSALSRGQHSYQRYAEQRQHGRLSIPDNRLHTQSREDPHDLVNSDAPDEPYSKDGHPQHHPLERSREDVLSRYDSRYRTKTRDSRLERPASTVPSPTENIAPTSVISNIIPDDNQIRKEADRKYSPKTSKTSSKPGRDQPAYRGISRSSRFLSLLTLVRFSNGVCNGTSGSNGTCYTSSECTSRGGIAEGTCADGYGVCCVFMKTCGQATSVNNTYFVNDNYPASTDGTGSCQLQINKINSKICQIRLDFDVFSIADPDSGSSQCLSDQFTASAASPAPPICGKNTGNHMYLDAGLLGTNTPVIISVITSGASFSRSWKIRVSQIACNEIYTAEPGCLQYHTGVSGRIKSFNFDFDNGRQLSNQDYAVCVRMEHNFCGVQYKLCTDEATGNDASFSLGGGTSTVSALTGTSCDKDWLIIPCATDNVNQPLYTMSNNNVCVDRLCGDQFNPIVGSSTSTSVYSFVKPFRVFVHTDDQESNSSPSELDNRGFCLDYVQQPCTAK